MAGRMLDLNDFFYYVQVVDRGGFTAAGRLLGVPKSTLSHRIQQLEKNLDVRLLNRTSRRFVMTDAGEEFYRHALTMLQHAGQAEAAMRQRQSEPSGTVRFTAPLSVAQFGLQTILVDFVRRFPKVDLFHHATSRQVDLVGENFDVAIRAHSAPLPDSTLVQRTLGPAPWFLFAAPSLFDETQLPGSPADLAPYPALYMARGATPPSWHLRNTTAPGDDVILRLAPRIVSDDLISLKHAARAGLGIVALPGYVCRDDIRSGQLVRVLPHWLAGTSTLSAIIPHRRGLLPSVRAFVDCLATEFPKVLSLD